jgi:hypothetical protein
MKLNTSSLRARRYWAVFDETMTSVVTDTYVEFCLSFLTPFFGPDLTLEPVQRAVLYQAAPYRTVR